MSPAALDKLPTEILEEIFAELEFDRDALEALGLTCRVLFACTSPHRFPTITLHDNNFEHFMELTHAVPWNGILPNIQRLVLGTKMFRLSRGYIGKPKTDPGPSRDLAHWASQIHDLRTLDLRGAVWSAFPQYFADALLSLRVDYLIVSLKELKVEDLGTTILTNMCPRMLSISGPPWVTKSIPPTPSYLPDSRCLSIHYMQLDDSTPTQELIDWLRTCDPPLSLVHLYIAFPRDKEYSFRSSIIEILHLVSPVHLQLKLPATAQDEFQYPIETFTNLKTLQISSIYNDAHLAQIPNPQEIIDVMVTCSILKQFAALQDRMRVVQLDFVCAHLHLHFGNIPKVLETAYPNLRSLALTLRSGRCTSRDLLDEWLDNGPFVSLRSRGVELKIEAGGVDPPLLSP